MPYAYGIGGSVTPFGVPALPWSPLLAGGWRPQLVFNVGNTYGRTQAAGIPEYLTDPIQRLLYALPRWGFAAAQQAQQATRDAITYSGSNLTVLPQAPIVPRGLSKKKLKKLAKQNYFAVPVDLQVATYGVNRPLIRGSRDDPEGGIAPPKYPWPGRLRPTPRPV